MRRFIAVGFVFLIVLFYQNGFASAADPPRIVINIAACTLSHYIGDTLVKEYPIAVGKPNTPSPLGEYQVIDKVVNPWWYPTIPGMRPVPSGPDNPLGYRWIGFASTYGIHGTNAPWSIGTSASKGCIRMHEEDVEELFPQIPVGTPVSIIYDTIRITEDAKGTVYATVHEDIYGYGTSTVTRFRQKLAAIGAEDLISDAQIRKFLQNAAAKPQNIGNLVNVKLNDKSLAAKGILTGDIIYVPAAAVAEATGASLTTDHNDGRMEWQGKTVSALLRPNGMYVPLWVLPELLGAQCTYDETTATAAIELIQVLYNGKPLVVRTATIDGIIALPLPALLEAAGLKAQWQPGETTATIAGRKIPAVMHDGVLYLQINRIEDALNMYVYYDTNARLIQLTYIPFIARGP